MVINTQEKWVMVSDDERRWIMVNDGMMWKDFGPWLTTV